MSKCIELEYDEAVNITAHEWYESDSNMLKLHLNQQYDKIGYK